MSDADPFSLTGRRFLVTGGTRGLGRAISLRFANAGADVIANYAHNEDAAAELTRATPAAGAIELCRADLTSPVGQRRVHEAVGDRPLYGIVHCAATGVHRSLDKLSMRHWDFTLALNVRAFFELVTGLLPSFASPASIVALSSEGAQHAFRHYTAVGASKGALESLCRHLASELAPRGIRVNVLSPGTVVTDAWTAIPDRDARLRAAAARTPRGQLTTPEEVAFAAQFLCSDAASGLTGHTLVVDAGQRTTAEV